MQITVKLFATFRNGRFSVEQREYPAGALCRDVVADVGISEGELGIVLLNGRHVQLEQELKGGDVLSLFPLVGGG